MCYPHSVKAHRLCRTSTTPRNHIDNCSSGSSWRKHQYQVRCTTVWMYTWIDTCTDVFGQSHCWVYRLDCMTEHCFPGFIIVFHVLGSQGQMPSPGQYPIVVGGVKILPPVVHSSYSSSLNQCDESPTYIAVARAIPLLNKCLRFQDQDTASAMVDRVRCNQSGPDMTLLN